MMVDGYNTKMYTSTESRNTQNTWRLAAYKMNNNYVGKGNT